MINLARLKMIKGRLTAAIQRHGLGTVLGVLFGSLFRHGLVATVRFGGVERPFPWKRTGARAAAALAGPEGPPPDLNNARWLDAAAWNRLRDGMAGGSLPAADPSEIPLLIVVVQGEEPAPGDMERTRAAVRSLGPSVRLWDEPDGATEPSAAGAYWVFLRPGDEPHADMPLAFAEAVRAGVAEVVSFDLWRSDGGRVQPLLAPGANPTLLGAIDYLFSRLALAQHLLPPGAALADVQPRERVLQWMRTLSPVEARGRWRHIGRPLVLASVSDQDIAQRRQAAFARGRRPLGKPGTEPVSVVILTHDKGHLTRQLAGRLLAEDPALVGEVVIVSNNVTNPYAVATLEDLARSPRVRVLRRDEPFNFSRLCNAGARHAQGRGPVLLLNDDIVPVSEDWLRRLTTHLEDPAVGAVGPLLLYPNERVQHAGIYLGYKGGAGHILRGARLPDDDYLFTACAPREVSAVTGAVLLTPRAAFEALGGLDEQLALAFQDVDYGLRLRGVGLASVFEPASVLIHMESVSIATPNIDTEVMRLRQAERTRYLQRWGALVLNDPLHPRGFDIQDETLRRLARKTD